MFIKQLIKCLFFKLRWRNKTQVSFSSRVSFQSTFEGMSKIYPDTTFHGHLGYGSYIAAYSSISAHVGRFTSIASYVSVNPGVHPYQLPYVSTSPCFFSTLKQAGGTFADRFCFDEFRFWDNQKRIAVKIGDDCWIGERVFIVGGVTINTGAVVLAGAVVTKDVPPYSIVGGVPAKVLRYRYDKATIDFLLSTRWWEKDIDWLKKHWRLFLEYDKFRSYFTNETNF